MPHVLGHAIQIEQVVLNLVRNAIEAMATCRPNDAISRARPCGGEKAVVEVRDTARAGA